MKKMLFLTLLLTTSSQLWACSMPPKSASITILKLLQDKVESFESIIQITLAPKTSIKTLKRDSENRTCYLKQYEVKWHPFNCSAELTEEKKEVTSCT